MRLSEKYGQCTAKGCNQILMEINNLDSDITIGEMRTYLSARAVAAKSFNEEAAEKLIKSVLGKIFKITFSEDHICYLKIDKIDVVEMFGIEGIIEGESITLYKGQISYNLIKKDNNIRYSSYFPNKDLTEIKVEEFESKKNLIQKIYSMS